MKKSISAILVADLMLFAFTACEQQVPNIPLEGDNDIANVVVVSAPSFYADDDEMTGIGTINVERVGGKTTKGVSANFALDGSKVNVGTNKVVISFGKVSEDGSSVTYENNWMTTINALSVTELKVDYVAPTTAVSSPSQVTVSSVKGVYSDGTLTDDLTYETDYTCTIDREKSALVITLNKGTYTNDDVSFSIPVTLSPVTEKIDSIDVVYDSEEVIVGQTFNPSLIEVTATIGTEKRVLDSDEYTLDYIAYTFTEDDVDAGITVKATLIADSTKTDTVNIKPVADYITAYGISVKPAEGETPAPTFKAGDDLSERVSDFVFTATRMKVASTVPADKEKISSDSITIDPAYSKIPVGATGTYTVWFTLDAEDNSNHAVRKSFDVKLTSSN